MKGKNHDLNHDLTFSVHKINCVCHSIRSMFRVLSIYNFGYTVEICRCHHFKGLMADLNVTSPKSSLIDYRKVVSNHFVVLLRANTVSFPTSPQLWP